AQPFAAYLERDSERADRAARPTGRAVTPGRAAVRAVRPRAEPRPGRRALIHAAPGRQLYFRRRAGQPPADPAFHAAASAADPACRQCRAAHHDPRGADDSTRGQPTAHGRPGTRSSGGPLPARRAKPAKLYARRGAAAAHAATELPTTS